MSTFYDPRWNYIGVALAALAFIAFFAFCLSFQAQGAASPRLTARIVANTIRDMAGGKPIVLDAHFGNGQWRKVDLHPIDVTDMHSWKRAEPPKLNEYDIRVRLTLK